MREALAGAGGVAYRPKQFMSSRDTGGCNLRPSSHPTRWLPSSFSPRLEGSPAPEGSEPGDPLSLAVMAPEGGAPELCGTRTAPHNHGTGKWRACVLQDGRLPFTIMDSGKQRLRSLGRATALYNDGAG